MTHKGTIVIDLDLNDSTDDVLSEHTLNTAAELEELLAPLDEMEGVPFDFGPDLDVSLEFRPDAVGDKVFLKLGASEYALVGDSGEQLFRKANLSKELLNDYPPELTVPLINWYLTNTKGSLKALVLDNRVVAFVKQATEVYSQVDILDSILRTLRDSYGVTDVRIHNVSHDLNLTQYTLMFPQRSTQLEGGDVLMAGLFVQNSLLGKDQLKISAVTARDYHHNAHISETLGEQWDRRRSRAASLEDAVEGEEGSDVYAWVEDTTKAVFKLSDNDVKSVVLLDNASVGSHSGTVLNSLLDKHSVPSKLRGYIREQYADEDGSSFLNLWNAISMVANRPEVEDKPKNVRKLMAVAGSLAAHPAVCRSCFRPTEDLDD